MGGKKKEKSQPSSERRMLEALPCRLQVTKAALLLWKSVCLQCSQGSWCKSALGENSTPSPCRGPHGQRAARQGPRQRFRRKAARLPAVRRLAGPCGLRAGTSAPCVADRMLALAPHLQEVVEDTCG